MVTPAFLSASVHELAVLGNHTLVIFGVEEKAGRRVRGDVALTGNGVELLLAGTLGQQGGDAAVAEFGITGDHRVAEHGEVRTGRDLGNGIIPAHTLTIQGSSGAGQVTAGGETENADLGGVDTEVLGVMAHVLDGAQGIRHWNGVEEARAIPGRQAILEHEAGNTALTEILGHIVALVLGGLAGITPAGADDHGGGGLVGGLVAAPVARIDAELWAMDHGQQAGPLRTPFHCFGTINS